MDAILEIFLAVVEFSKTGKGIFTLLALALLIKIGPGLWLLIVSGMHEGASMVDKDIVTNNFLLSTSRVPSDKPGPAEDRYRGLVSGQDWDTIHSRLLADDAARAADATGRRYTRIGINAAMGEIDAAIGPGGPDSETRALEAIQEFEARLGQAPNNLAAAVLTAQAHMEIGWIYRGNGTMDTVSAKGLDAMQYHFDQAMEILRPFKVAQRGSPMLAAANFRLAVGQCGEEMLFHSARSIWLSVDPSDPEMMAQVAFHLLPRWYGSHGELVKAAANIATVTQVELGEQAYAMMLLSVAIEEPDIARKVDVQRLMRGVTEMIEASDNNQQVINHAAAGLFYMMLNCVGSNRKILRAGLRGLLETKMKAVMTDLWPDPIGEIRASLASLFCQELEAGATITINEEGFTLLMPEAAGSGP